MPVHFCPRSRGLEKWVAATSFSSPPTFPSIPLRPEKEWAPMNWPMSTRIRTTCNSFPTPRFPPHGPVWLLEGCADFQAFKALDAGGVIQYDQIRASTVNNALSVQVALRNLETYDQVLTTQNAYALGTLACELLAGGTTAGESALLSYWTLRTPDISWQDTFRQSFGLTIEEFYPRFEQHRAAGFPVLSSEDPSEVVNVSHEYTFAVDVPQGYVKQNATYWLSEERGSHVWGELHLTPDRLAQSVRSNVQQEWMTGWPSAPLTL